MSPSAACAVARNVTRTRARWLATAKRLLPLRAPPRMKSDETMTARPSREDRRGAAPGQVSWLSDRPTPRAFPVGRPVASAGFVPDHSDGVAADSHRLPCVSQDIPGTNDAGTVAESTVGRNAGYPERAQLGRGAAGGAPGAPSPPRGIEERPG